MSQITVTGEWVRGVKSSTYLMQAGECEEEELHIGGGMCWQDNPLKYLNKGAEGRGGGIEVL